MLICKVCKLPIQGNERLSYILPEEGTDVNTPLEYLHYPACSRKYFGDKEEAHIIRGEN